MRVHDRAIAVLVIFMAVGAAMSSIQAAEPRRAPGLAPAGRSATTETAPTGQLLGMVTDDAGAPVQTMLVSASGPAGTAVAKCDKEGRFEFRNLRPGIYLLRAHASGFTTRDRHVVEIKPGLSTLHSLRLERVTAKTASSSVLTAGVTAGFGAGLGPAWLSEAVEEQPLLTEPNDPDRIESPSPAPHDHTEKAWRLRRARRSVLKDEGFVRVADTGNVYAAPFDETAALPGSPRSDLLNGFAVSGQFHLLTRATLDSPARPWSMNQLPGQVAYVTLGSPVDELGWGVRGAVTAGDSGSWVLAGSYATETSPSHGLELGVSYSRQRAAEVENELGLVPDERYASDLYTNREVASVAADGVWTASPRLSVGYGATLAHYGYLANGQAVSPRARVVVEPIDRTRIRAAVVRHMLAPGAEEFLPPSSGVWLPPERTFAPLSPTAPLQLEETRHVEVALERDVGDATVVGVRRFYQDVANQMITMFGVRPNVALSSTDHYYFANAAGFNADGWGVSFSHALAGRVHGVVDYSVTRARWAPMAIAGLSPSTVGVLHTGTERIHDVTTSVETEIPETATSVFVLARINTAYSRVDEASIGSGLDTRFAFRVTQTLPFAPFGGSDWEVLVDVRSLFREQVTGASVYDELLVVDPPKQFVGGLVVHF